MMEMLLLLSYWILLYINGTEKILDITKGVSNQTNLAHKFAYLFDTPISP